MTILEYNCYYNTATRINNEADTAAAAAFHSKQTNSALRAALLSPLLSSKQATEPPRTEAPHGLVESTQRDKLQLQLNAWSSAAGNQQQSKQQQQQQHPLSEQSHHALNWTWTNELASCHNERSPPVMLAADGKSVCLHPFCHSCFETNAVRAAKPLRANALTYWEVELSAGAASGTSVMIGVGTAHTPLNVIGYTDLLGGADRTSWALSSKGTLFHDGHSATYCYPFEEESGRPIVIGCLYDGYTGRLFYYKNGRFLGVAFQGMRQSGVRMPPLYAMVSSTVARSMFKIVRVFESFPTLQELCRLTVQQQPVAAGLITQTANSTTHDNMDNRLPACVINYLSQ